MHLKSFLRHVRPLIFAGAMIALVFTFGCVTGAGEAATPGITFEDGRLAASLTAGLDQAARAANTAMGQLGLARVREDRDTLTDTLIVRSAADKLIRLTLETIGDGLTKVTISVGAFGDKPMSLAMLAKIKANLVP